MMKGKLPNIILIVMDTVGAKHMSLYGYPRKTTPHLERIAEECSVYTRCFAPSCWTIPSHASMFTGLYPSQHGTNEVNFFLSENIQHIVPALKMAGYRTFGISSNSLVSPANGLCPGFDYFKTFGTGGFGLFQHFFDPKKRNGDGEGGILPRIRKVLTTKERIKIIIRYFIETRNYRQGCKDVAAIIKNRIDRFINPNPFQKSSKYTDYTIGIFREILKNICSSNVQPFFLFINFLEAHELYKPPLKLRRFSRWHDKQFHRMYSFYEMKSSAGRKLCSIYNALYDDEIYYLDSVLYQLWNILKASPAFDDTMIIITSDHGEHFGEKGHYGHSISLYNELIWVPLIVRFPQTIAGKGFKDALVSLNDLYSTIQDLVASPFPSPDTSISLLGGSARDLAISQVVYPMLWESLLKAKQQACLEEGSDFFPPIMAAITTDGKKVIETSNGGLEIYDLNRDMNEDYNLWADMSTEARKDLQEMMTYLKNDTGYPEAVKQALTFIDNERPTSFDKIKLI